MPKITHYAAPSRVAPPPLSYAVRTGNLLFVSGLPGFDAAGVLPPAFADQFAHVVASLRRVLDEAGGRMADLVKVSVLLTRPGDVAPMNALYAQAFGPAPYPARITYVVVALPNPDMLIEIECVCALDPAD